jgi:N-acetylneuraminic acid mutarotase
VYYGPIAGATTTSETETSSTWTAGAKMPTPRTEHLADDIGEKIYVMGGVDYTKNSQLGKIEIYDTSKNEWTSDAKPMPVPIDHGAAVAYNDKIYVAGGFIKGKIPTDKLFIYDTIKDEWTEGKPLSAPRGALGAQFVNDILYVVGGVNASMAPVSTVEAYDPKTNTWTSKASMLTERHHLELAELDGKLFALGGRILGDGVPSEDMDEDLSNFNRNEMYDPDSNTWTIKEPMLSKRSGFASTSADGKIYIFGGEGIGETLGTVEKYDPLIDTWTKEPSMPSERIGLEAVAVGNKVYAIGGQIYNAESGLIALDMNEIFNLNVDNKSKSS